MSVPTNDTVVANVSFPSNQFHLFVQLHDELQLTILSFVADAPFANSENLSGPTDASDSISNRCIMYTSTLTHVLPYVCRKFHKFCNTADQLWKDAILRQLMVKEPTSWYDALQNIIHNTTNKIYTNDQKKRGSNLQLINESDKRNDRYYAMNQLVEQAYGVISMQHRQLHDEVNYRYLYRVIVNTQLRQICPVFIMRGDIVLNESYGLHLFEYRYRYMIHILIQKHSQMVQQQSTQQQPFVSSSSDAINHRTQLLEQFPVYFIHANRGNVRRSEMAVVVQLMECVMYSDGRADIVVKPVHFVWIERAWLYTSQRNVHPNMIQQQEPETPHNLYYAQVFKMGQDATNAMHHLQRQETLATVLERLMAAGFIQQQQDVDNDDDDDEMEHESTGTRDIVRRVHINIMENVDEDDDDDNNNHNS